MWEDFQQHLWLLFIYAFSRGIDWLCYKIGSDSYDVRAIKVYWYQTILGWQGIIPSQKRWQSTAADTLTARLISTRELYNKIDPTEIIKALERAFN